MRFFLGLHQPSDARHFAAAFISVKRLSGAKGRVSDFPVGDWIMDSGAFSEIAQHGRYLSTVEEYAALIRRWSKCGRLLAAVSQDWMCESKMLARTGMTIAEHQRLTVERYDALRACDTSGVYVMPVLQGYAPADYIRHRELYGPRLAPGAWVGVGSVCKRNGDPAQVAAVLLAIKQGRPDLRLHGFGLKSSALSVPLVRELLESADSMAWSYSARRQGRSANCWLEARDWLRSIEQRTAQLGLFGSSLS